MSVMRITIRNDLQDDAKKELVELAPYLNAGIESVRVDGPTATVMLEEGLVADIEELDRSINRLADSLAVSHLKDFTEILFVSTREPKFTGNPWSHLLESQCVKQIEPGLCYLSGEVYELMESIDSLFAKYARSIGALLESYVSILPFGSAQKNGYLEGFPQHAFFVASAHQSLASLDRIAKADKPSDLVSSGSLGNPSHLLAPTVCYHCFEALKSTEISGTAVYSARGLCHRNEGRSANTLLRLKVFNMREIMFFGTAEFVEKMRTKILEYCKSVFDEIGLAYRVASAADPFFASGAEQRRIFQKISRSKLELQMYIPYIGAWVAVASFNNHLSTLTRKYSIGPSGTCSGCFGFGYERLIYALISQIGCDIEEVRKALDLCLRRIEDSARGGALAS